MAKKSVKDNSMKRLPKVNTEQFLNVKTPEIAYILGFIWADGCIINNDSRKAYAIQIANIMEDSLEIYETFKKTGDWNFHEKKEKNKNLNKQGVISTFNKKLVQYLTENDYKSKSFSSPDKILLTIPDNLNQYFFLGLIDGDGHISEKGKLEVSSGYDQNWNFLIKLCEKLKIKYKISRRENKKKQYKFSSFNISKTTNIVKFCEYIYQDYEAKKIGLERKYNNFVNLKKHFLLRQNKNLESGIKKYKDYDKYFVLFNLNKNTYRISGLKSRQEAILAKKKKILEITGEEGFKQYYGFEYD
jgi:hypothetical protein